MSQTEKTKAIAASKAGMDEKTARKYLGKKKIPSQCKKERTWLTRSDAFSADWPEIKEMLEDNPGFEAKTLFEYLQRKEPGKYQDSQLRTLQRRIKVWRATEGPGQEVFFPQKHSPGELCASDFTHMTSLGITINGELFHHLLYHFVLTYSNWEAGTICFSESYESLSEGLQNALWELGGVPDNHRTDRLTAAVNKSCNREEFTSRYRSLLRHYGLQGEKTQPHSGNENGDIEQRNHRIKRALEQALLLRGSRDFVSREEYSTFLQKLFCQLNAGRKERLQEEMRVLHRLPERRLEDFTRERVRVGPSSTIRVRHNTYSVHSRLIKAWIQARVYAEFIEIWYAQKKVDIIPRIRGENKHRIQYRHIIDWLVRKPGAFANYRYREDLFPSSYFRMAYDQLQSRHSQRKADREYLNLLYLSAQESESKTEQAIRLLIEQGEQIDLENVRERMSLEETFTVKPTVMIADVNLKGYDALYESEEVLCYE